MLSVTGCSAGLSERTREMRTALDAGDPRRAIAHLNGELGVSGDGERPRRLVGEQALLLLDRATLQQSIAQLANSKRDYEAADKAIDALDLSHGASDDVGRWVFSDAAGRYVAPPHEKLLVNVLNLVNYLETGDLSGARIEARRMSVMARYLKERDPRERRPSAALGVGSLLAGFAYEKSGNDEEAHRYYADANAVEWRARSISPERTETTGSGSDDGELLVVVGWGRVPHRVAQHVPIGLALTRGSPFLAAGDRDAASRLAAQGLVTWVSYPTLAPERPLDEVPTIVVDGRAVPLDATLDVAAEVRAEWRRIEGDVLAAAITRTVARVLVGKAIEGAANTSDKKEVKAAGFLLSLFAQAAMSAADVPDTRSWETLPARIGIARVQLPPGEHRVLLRARGTEREGDVRATPGGWRAISLFALR
ncbi:MAG: hypothetical protein JWP87_5716 [Labilithrix sp.]|nr:hypothetical protein [Labilithrix sp.]